MYKTLYYISVINYIIIINEKQRNIQINILQNWLEHWWERKIQWNIEKKNKYKIPVTKDVLLNCGKKNENFEIIHTKKWHASKLTICNEKSM